MKASEQIKKIILVMCGVLRKTNNKMWWWWVHVCLCACLLHMCVNLEEEHEGTFWSDPHVLYLGLHRHKAVALNSENAHFKI